MSASIDLSTLRAAFKSDNNENNSRPNNYYPFWKMNTGEQAIVRFLPDKNSENPLGFLVEKRMHKLPINGETKSIPCLTMYGEECPICKVSQSYYQQDDKENGKKYWRKKQHIAQALIVEDPLPPDPETKETHEGKIRYLGLSYQLFNVIKEAFESGELDEVPFAYEGGCNFVIKKVNQGGYDNYAIGSRFSRKISDLSEEETDEAQSQLVDLETLLPPNPGVEKVEAMLQAAITGSALQDDDSSSSSSDQSSTAESSVASENENADTSTSTQNNDDSDSGDDDLDSEAEKILNKIRNRNG